MTSFSRLAVFVLLFVCCLSVNGQQRRLLKKIANCKDQMPQCNSWALQGECYHNRGFMTVYCPESCDQCNVDDPSCRDQDFQCAAWADRGECFNNVKFMEKTCAKSCSICLPAADHSVPHIHSNIVKEFWKGNEVKLNLLRQRK